jgi:hypothetical protein
MASAPRATDQEVVAQTTSERVVARATIECVVAVSTIDDIGDVAGTASNGVVVIGANNVLDARQDISLGVAADTAGTGRQVDRDPGRGGGVIYRVGTGATSQRISPRPANQDVVAQAAVEDVDAGITDQRVIVVGAGDIFDPRDDISIGIAT